MSLPNVITVLRIVSVPAIVWLIITGHMQAAFFLFIAAGISDGIDGFIAKNFNQTTQLGAYLDPIADKALLMSIYVALGYHGDLPSFLVILVVSRDILIIGAVVLSWMVNRPVTVAPLMVSKVNTTGQIVLAGLVLAKLGFDLPVKSFVDLSVLGVAVLTIASGVAYLVEWFHHMAHDEPV